MAVFFSTLFTNRWWWQEWSSSSLWLLWLSLSHRQICLPLTSQTTIRNKEICSHYNWLNRAAPKYFALSKHFRQFYDGHQTNSDEEFTGFGFLSMIPSSHSHREPGCQHLGLIIKVFQAVPSSHKNRNACAPDPRVFTMTKNAFSVTKLIRLLLVFWWKNESRFNEENDKVNLFP